MPNLLRVWSELSSVLVSPQRWELIILMEIYQA